jgi:DNA-binding protein
MTDTSASDSPKLPAAVVKRIMTDAGAQRVSGDAVAAMQAALLDYGKRLTSDAVAAASHAKRSTVKGEDVEMARKGLH